MVAVMNPRSPAVPLALVACLLSPRVALAEPTRELSLSGAKEILEGDPESASVDAHGRVTLGPNVVELARAADHPILSLVAGPGGVVFAGTAGGGVLRISPGGETKVLAPLDGLVVSALQLVRGTLYAATSPDGKIVSIGMDGATKTVFDPAAKYIWAMLEDGPDLLVATGEPGQVVRVGPAGPAKGPFEPGETHVRALLRHPKRGIIAGGGQKGIVYQLRGDQVFALHDSDMEEVTALAADPDSGDLYVAVVSESKPGSFDPEKSIGAVAGDAPEPDPAASPIKGSDVLRITAGGRVDVLFSSKREGALALAFDATKKQLFIATGTQAKGRGRIYAVDVSERDRLRLAARVEAPLVSALLLAPTGGAILAGTAPGGQVLRVGPGPRSESTYVSLEQDLVRPSRVGRIWYDADLPPGAKVLLSVRSGNTKEHDKTWSPWSAEIGVAEGGPVQVPEGRFVQLRARLFAAPNGGAPTLKSLHASVRRMNVAPTVAEVFALRRGVYMAKMPREEEKEKTVTLTRSVLTGLRREGDDDDGLSLRVRQGIRPGMLTVSWRADDPNGDAMIYRLEVRRDGEDSWQELATELEEVFHSLDSRAYRDGRYQFRVTASDRPANPPGEALLDRNLSEPVIIDNTAPVLQDLKVTSPGPGRLEIAGEAIDETTPIAIAQVSLDGGPWLMLPAADGLTDSRRERLELSVAPSSDPGAPRLAAGAHTVLVRVEDEAGNSVTGSARVVVR